ncbi:hypothetical protein Tco_1129210, partial [Tanacetum coccineum]
LFEEVLDRMEQPVDIIIADVTLKWILEEHLVHDLVALVAVRKKHNLYY